MRSKKKRVIPIEFKYRTSIHCWDFKDARRSLRIAPKERLPEESISLTAKDSAQQTLSWSAGVIALNSSTGTEAMQVRSA